MKLKTLLASLLIISPLVQAKAPQNIIMVIADGMGPEYTTAYRYFKDDKTTAVVERTIFDKYLVGSSSTYPAEVSGYVTDSAASATALASGVKSYNGAIGVDVNKNPVESVLEKAKSLGYRTGAVVTSQINHATPASYIAHNESRRNYNEIADSYIDDKIASQYKFDLLLGGGWKYFIREDRNLVEELKSDGFQYIDSYTQLAELTPNTPAIGLFADVGLPYAIDDTNTHRLSTMAKHATRLLSNEKGFFLLIEASQVDWAGHANDIAGAMSEMEDLAKTMEYLEHFVEQNPDTLVVLTADHSTGGMSLAKDGVYEWRPEDLRTLSRTPRYFSQHFTNETIDFKSVKSLMNIELNDTELKTVKQVKVDALVKLDEYNNLSKDEQKQQRKPNVARAIETTFKSIIDDRTNTGWTTGGHIAIDVPVIAFGLNHQLFKGSQDNTDIAKKLFSQLTSR